MSSRRDYFKKCAALGAAALLVRHSKAKEALSQKNYSCFGDYQAGIVTPQQKFNITAAFDVVVENRQELINLFKTLTTRIIFLTEGRILVDPQSKQYPPSGSGLLGQKMRRDNLTITVGVGASLFDKRFGLQDLKPKHLQEFKRFKNDRLNAEFSDGDLSIQICADSPEVCQNALRDVVKYLSGSALLRWCMDGFITDSEDGGAPRNLLGFRDGSGNPDVSNPEIAEQVLWTGSASNAQDEPEWTKNGTYQVVRFIRNFVEFWDRTPLQEQEKIFGRFKYNGAPLSGEKEFDLPKYHNDDIPDDAHIKLANPRTPEFMEKHQILRRSYNYFQGLSKSKQLDMGLIFICYQANLADGFIFIQNRLNFEPLEEYIKPWSGAYFFVLPGFKPGEFLGQSLFASL